MNRSLLAAVVCAAAIACAGSPTAPADPPRPVPLGGGMGVALLHGIPLLEANWFWFCTLAAVGYDAHGNLVGITNAHCVYDYRGRQWPGDELVAESALSAAIADPAAADNVEIIGTVAYISGGNPLVPGPNGVGLDYAVVVFDESKVTPVPTVVGKPVRRIAPPPPPGTTMCKEGVTTGYSCGTMLGTVGPYIVDTITESTGDSGAPIVVDDALVGIQWVSGGATAMTAIMADLDRRGGIGSGFRLVTP